MLTTSLQLTLLLLVANGAPVLAKDLLGGRWAWPVDFGLSLPDRRRLLGDSCSWRGLVAAIAATAVTAWLLDLGFGFGAALGALAMSGDMLSSFVKRRLGLPPGSMALVLDQVPESLLPLLWARQALVLDAYQVLGLTLSFLVLELVLSRILYRYRLRAHPY